MDAFSISVSVTVPFRLFGSMEWRATLGMDKKAGKSHITLCGHPCGDLCPCLEKVVKHAWQGVQRLSPPPRKCELSQSSGLD